VKTFTHLVSMVFLPLSTRHIYRATWGRTKAVPTLKEYLIIVPEIYTVRWSNFKADTGLYWAILETPHFWSVRKIVLLMQTQGPQFPGGLHQPSPEGNVMEKKQASTPNCKDTASATGRGLVQGAGLGVALGAGIGAAFDHVALGAGVGVAIGPALGMLVMRACKK